MKIEWKTCFKIGISAFLLYLGIFYWSGVSAFLGKLIAALIPLFAGFIIAYIIGILLDFYDRKIFGQEKNRKIFRFRKPISATLAILSFVAVITAVIWLIVPQLISAVTLLISSLPDAAHIIIESLKNSELLPQDIAASLESIDWSGLVSQFAGVITNGMSNIVTLIVDTVSSVIGTVTNAVFSIMFAFYILFSRDTLKAQFNRLAKSYLPFNWREKATRFVAVLNDSFHRFIVGQFFEALIIGSLCTIGMLVLSLPYAPMIGALVAFTALIPIVGAYVGAVVGALLILTVSPIKALVFLIFLITLQAFEGNLIYPKVVGSSINLPGIWVLAAVTVFGGLFGVIGMFLGVPLTAAAYRLIREDLGKREAAENNI